MTIGLHWQYYLLLSILYRNFVYVFVGGQMGVDNQIPFDIV